MARALLIAALLTALPSVARAGEPVPAAVETLLGSPIAAERDDGVRLLVSAGSAGVDAARTLCSASRLPLRLGGWRALGAIGAAEDLDAGLAALEVVEGAEAQAVGQAVLALAGRLPTPEHAPLPAGALSPRAARALEGAVEDLLWRSSPDDVPPALLHLGSGLVPCLAGLAERPRLDRGLCAEVIDALAAVGGHEARLAIARLLELDLAPQRTLVFRGLRQTLPGPGLEGAQAAALGIVVGTEGGRRRNAERQESALFLQACPPQSPDPQQRRQLVNRVLNADAGPRGGQAVELLRAWLALGSPTDEELERVSRVVEPAEADRGWLVLALESVKDRAPVRRALERLAGRDDLPPATAGWVGLFLGTAAPEDLLASASRAILAPVGAAGPDGRRLGLLLLGRLDVEPPPELVQIGLEEGDTWCRVYALHLLRRLPAAGPLHALARACARDRDPWVVEASAWVATVPWDAALRARLAEQLLGGPRDLRTRIVALLQSRGEAEGSAESPEAVGGGPLDVRIRLASRLVGEGSPR